MAARTLDLTSERLRATLEAIRRPGGGLDTAITPDTTGLGVGYRWSSLAAGDRAQQPERPGPRAGDRAPDAPCADAATGVRTRLHRVFAGPRTTVLGFGPGSAAVLRGTADAYCGGGVRVCRVYAAHEDRAGAEPGAVVDDAGHASAAYGTGASGDTGAGTVVVVRPDHHVGVLAPAGDARSVREYLQPAPRNGPVRGTVPRHGGRRAVKAD